jgi:hypothetical protein
VYWSLAAEAALHFEPDRKADDRPYGLQDAQGLAREEPGEELIGDIGAVPGSFEETLEQRRVGAVLAVVPLQLENARLSIDAGVRCMPLLHALK